MKVEKLSIGKRLRYEWLNVRKLGSTRVLSRHSERLRLWDAIVELKMNDKQLIWRLFKCRRNVCQRLDSAYDVTEHWTDVYAANCRFIDVTGDVVTRTIHSNRTELSHWPSLYALCPCPRRAQKIHWENIEYLLDVVSNVHNLLLDWFIWFAD